MKKILLQLSIILLFSCEEVAPEPRIYDVRFEASGEGGGPYSISHTFAEGELPQLIDSIELPYRYGFQTETGGHGGIVQLTLTSDNGGEISAEIHVNGKLEVMGEKSSSDSTFISTRTLVYKIP